MNIEKIKLRLYLLSTLIFIANQVAAQSTRNVIDEAYKSLQERNIQYGEESKKKATETLQKIYLNQNLTQEQIHFNKVRAELRPALETVLYNLLRDEKLNDKETGKFIDDYVNATILCHKKYWSLMPEDLRLHIILLSSNENTIQSANRMAMEDYKKKFLNSGKSEDMFTAHIEEWAKEYKTCEKSINISPSNYKK
jgi:hypothetical protein